MGTLLPSAPSDSTPPTIQASPTPLENGNPIRMKTNKTLMMMRGKNKRKKLLFSIDEASSSSSSAASTTSSSFSSAQRNSLPVRRKLVVARLRRSRREDGVRGENLDAFALPLGMSFAAVIAQRQTVTPICGSLTLEQKNPFLNLGFIRTSKVLERKDAAGERMMSAELLSAICTTAVRESLANVFGDKFELFANNFQRSFRSTLRTLRVINESSFHKADHNSGHLKVDEFSPGGVSDNRIGCTSTRNFLDQSDVPISSVHNLLHSAEEREGQLPTISLTRELTLRGHDNQLTYTPCSFGSRMELSTVERSVMEQSRSNDLKALEIGISMRRLKLKEEQIALSSDSNRLERTKIAMGVEKASFRAEKFKSQLEDTRHAELLQHCTDCLGAGLMIMAVSLLYGASVYSHIRVVDATKSCTAAFEETKSWWVPKSFSSINSNLHYLWCQVQAWSQILSGFLMAFTIVYLVFQRCFSHRSTMPVTFILLLLGVICGFAGKLCVDKLGGDSLLWLMLWETICCLHLLTNVFTSTVYRVLCGSLDISPGGSRPRRRLILLPYWLRRAVFYTVALLVLPLCCGLLPFAGFREWKDHFAMLAVDLMPTSKVVQSFVYTMTRLDDEGFCPMGR